MKKNVLCIFLISIFAWLIISCSMPASSGSDSSSDNSSSLAVPVISPSAGDYSEGYKEITITTENSKNDIYYTTDGTTPNTKSNRYTAPFNIIGSKTVKAVAYSGTNSSAVVTAIYNLNAGKSASQLGVITGSVGLASNLENDTKSLLNGKTVYIYSDDIPGAVYQSSIGGSFYIDSLDTSKSYNFYFSTKAPGTIISSRTAAVQTDDDGSAIVSAIISNVMPKEGAGLDVATVELKPTGIIKGVAKKYGDDGSMESDHAGITVFIPGTSYSALTASNGSFSISGVPQGLHTIRAMYSGYTFSEQENILLASKGDEIPETEITQDFALYYAKGTVRGFVYLDENSSNNAGVDVVLTDQSNKHSYNAVTTSSGNWTINDVLPGVYNAEFHKDGYVLQVLNDINVIGAKVTVTPQIFLKENGGRIYGYVSVTATTNLSGIGVTAIKNDNNSEKRYYALTASDGSFTFDSVGPGTYTVSAVYPGYKTATLSNIVVSVGSEVSTGTLTIDEKATYSITGSCVLAGMESGFEGTAVLLQSLTDSTNTKSTTTASDGVYVITDVDSGSYILTFSHPGFVSDSTKTVNVGLNAIEVVENVALQTNAGFVSGNVTLESADIQAGIVILIYKENDTSTSYTTVTDSKGHFAISGVSPGTYRVQATKNGYTTGVSDPFIVSSGITSGPADMQLSISLRSIYGTVKLAGKTDYTGIRITATKTTKTKEIYSALSNKDGFFALSSMTPGEYILSFAFEGYRSYTSSSISLSEDSSRELDEIELVQATGKISGIVNLEGCTDHSGIKVSIVGTEYTCITDSDGLYEFSVPSGNYPGGVRFEKEDFQLTAKAETITVLTDSTYGVLTVEMKATANTLKGIIQLAGTEDYSGITVTVDGLDSEVYKYITESDGYWQLDHVPLGYQTIRFSKLNVPDVTVEKQVIASESINIGTLEMIPDSATLRGYVFLDGMSDSSGINVTITTLERDDIVVRTTSDGAFEANNILASGSHTITFSKEGWDSKAITISDFTPLEVRTIGAGREYILSDTTSPAWNTNPIVINSGANFANNTKLHIDLSPLEKGSGIEKMSVQIARTVDGVTGSLYPSTYNWQNYQIGFDFDINDLPEQYVGNGTYTFYIALKDKSGNISTTEHKVITLTDLVTTLTGVLIGDKLHLREECSPYLVEADCLVSEDKTLVIDPGVEIRFAGNYSISITGSIYARGTAEKKILFTSDYEKQGNYDTSFYWKGIAINGGSLVTENSYNYISGNIMEYCEFEYADTPLTIKESTYINKCYFHDCVNGVKKENAVGTVILNNTLKNGIDFGERGFLINNIIEESLNISELYSWHGSNSLVSNNTIENATLYFSYGSFIYINNNTFINCRINVESNTNDGAPTINNNNFIDCPNPIVSTTWEYKSGFSYNFTNNYWGAAQTDELNSKGKEANISFISDYYDNFNYVRINYSDWAIEPISCAGYSANGLILFDYTVNGYNYDYGGYYPESTSAEVTIGVIPQYHINDISSVRIAQSISSLQSASWLSYSENHTFTIDTTNLTNGMATLYVQLKDDNDNLSGIVMHEVPYDSPIVTLSINDGATYSSATNSVNLNYGASDNCNLVKYELYLDEEIKASGDYSDYGWGKGFNCDYTINLQSLSIGNHTIKLTVWDSAGNSTTKQVTIKIK